MEEVWPWIVARWDDLWLWFERPLTNGSLVLLFILSGLWRSPELNRVEDQLARIRHLLYRQVTGENSPD